MHFPHFFFLTSISVAAIKKKNGGREKRTNIQYKTSPIWSNFQNKYVDVEKFYLCWQKYPHRNRSIESQQPALAVCISFSSIPFGTARLSEAHSTGGCASSDMDEDAPGRNGNTVVSSTFFSDHNACWLWNGGLSLLLYTRTGQALMCIQSKLFFLGMPAAMQSKRKGKQALKWALKPSLRCSENKSLFAAKKKINWQRYRVSFFTVYPAYTRTFTLLCSSTNWHQLRHGSTRRLELLHGWPGRAPCSSLRLTRLDHLPSSTEVDTAWRRQDLPASLCSAGVWGQVPTGPAAPPQLSCGFPFLKVGAGHSAAAGWLGSVGQAFPITQPLLSSPPSSCKLLRSGVLFLYWAMCSITSSNK